MPDVVRIVGVLGGLHAPQERRKLAVVCAVRVHLERQLPAMPLAGREVQWAEDAALWVQLARRACRCMPVRV